MIKELLLATIVSTSLSVSSLDDKQNWIALPGNEESCFFLVKRSSCAALRISPSPSNAAALS